MMRRIRVSLAAASCLLASACGGPPPSASDVPVIMSEAAGETKPPLIDSAARGAVRDVFKAVRDGDRRHAEAVGKLFWRPELRSYFLLDHSFVGGTFPAGTAKLLREVEDLEDDYLLEQETWPDILKRKLDQADVAESERVAKEIGEALATQRQARVNAVIAVQRFIKKAAEVYELAAANSDSIKSMRTGLEISDEYLHERFNRLVDETNAANDAADAAIRALPAQDQADFLQMGVAKKL